METVDFVDIKQLLKQLTTSKIETEIMFKEASEMFKETSKMFKETDLKFKETDQELKEMFEKSDNRFKKTEELVKNLALELGGVGKSNGQIAEDFFYSALQKSLSVGNLKFDYIDRNSTRNRKNIEAEYDIVLFNEYKVLIVEVKYNFKQKYLRTFYNNLKNFRSLYPEYKEYKLYAAIAGMTFENEVLNEANEFGFFVITQNNQSIKLLNKTEFLPNEIK